MTDALDFGWWRFSPTPEGGRMDHIHTGEAFVAGSLLSPQHAELADKAHPTHPALVWRHFHYRHPDLEMQLAIGFAGDASAVILDYNLSLSGVDGQAPAYGTWARVDDAALEAFRIWPNWRTATDDAAMLRTFGGWFNGAWAAGLRREGPIFPHDLYAAMRKRQFRSPEPSPDMLQPLDAHRYRWEKVSDRPGLFSPPNARFGGLRWPLPQAGESNELVIGLGRGPDLLGCSFATRENADRLDVIAWNFGRQVEDIRSTRLWLVRDTDYYSPPAVLERQELPKAIRDGVRAAEPAAFRAIWRAFESGCLVAPLTDDRLVPQDVPAAHLPRRFILKDSQWIGDWMPMSIAFDPVLRPYFRSIPFHESFIDPSIATWVVQ